jgi:hypothetical protein
MCSNLTVLVFRISIQSGANVIKLFFIVSYKEDK